MGIVSVGLISVYSDIPEYLLELIEDLLLNRSDEGTENLLYFSVDMDKKRTVGDNGANKNDWCKRPIRERLSHALVNGVDDFEELDVYQVGAHHEEGHSCDHPGHGGRESGEHRRSSRLRRAEGRGETASEKYISVYMYESTIVIATVKVDVHDIGNNIVAVVLSCNNYRVIDLGVMCPCEKILTAVHENRNDVLGLSGLITPSKMHSTDASRAINVVSSLLDSKNDEDFIAVIDTEYDKLREENYTGLEERNFN